MKGTSAIYQEIAAHVIAVEALRTKLEKSESFNREDFKLLLRLVLHLRIASELLRFYCFAILKEKKDGHSRILARASEQR